MQDAVSGEEQMWDDAQEPQLLSDIAFLRQRLRRPQSVQPNLLIEQRAEHTQNGKTARVAGHHSPSTLQRRHAHRFASQDSGSVLHTTEHDPAAAADLITRCRPPSRRSSAATHRAFEQLLPK